MANSENRGSLFSVLFLLLGLGLLVGCGMLMVEARAVARAGGEMALSAPLQLVMEQVVNRVMAYQPDASPAEYSSTLHLTLFVGAALGLVLFAIAAMRMMARRMAARN